MTHFISIKAHSQADIQKVWDCFTQAQHVTGWNFASDDWFCPTAQNDLRPGGRFSYRMEARDGSFGFDLEGQFDTLEAPASLTYHFDDDRRIEVRFTTTATGTQIEQDFEPESQNPRELQEQGWQAILNNFAAYCDAQKA